MVQGRATGIPGKTKLANNLPDYLFFYGQLVWKIILYLFKLVKSFFWGKTKK
jgi:hypothetical protein